MIIDGVTQEMVDRTARKFEAWDRVVTEKELESSDESVRNLAIQLLEDPTIYMYAFFKDKYSKPLKLYSYQDAIINDSHPRIIFCAANQIGKSMDLCCKGTHFALTHPGATVLMVSKTLPQSKDLLREIKRLLNTSSLEYKADIGDAENKTEIYFKHYDVRTNEKGELEDVELPQSRIICVPATEAALGYPANLLLIDELAFYDDGEYFYYQIAQPRTYETKGQIIVFSNPNGQQGVFWNLWNNPDFHKYRFSFLDCPKNTQVEYEKLRASLSKEVFESTVDARFTSPIGGFLSETERKAIQEKRENFLPVFLSSPVYIFFDWGKSRDKTVRAIGVSNGTYEKPSIYIHELKEYPNGTPYDEIINELETLVKEIGYQNIAAVGWDNTGVGRGIEDFIGRLKDIGMPCNPIDFTLENKSAMYSIFKLLAERTVRGESALSMPFIAECDRQLSKLIFKKTSRGYLQVHHENESDFDDYCDSVAGLCGLIVNPGFGPVTLTIIDDTNSSGMSCPRCEYSKISDKKVCPICGMNLEGVV